MRCSRLLICLVLALLLAVEALPQSMPDGVQKGASVEGITEYTFPNGLRVLLFPDPSNPKVTVNMTYLVGSRHEGYGETGMAHLLEHLLFIKTTNGRDIKKEITGRGAQWNGSTWYDRTNYYETVTASDDNLRWALGLEADRMVNCLLSKELLDTEMTVVRNEFEMGENNSGRVLSQRVAATAYLWHNYGKPTIGSRADIENVPVDRLAAFYRKYYQPDNAVLVIAGQFDQARVLGFVADTFGRTPRPQRKLEITYTAEPAQDGERYVALRRVGDEQSIVAAYHAPAAGHPDSAVLEVLAGIMSGGGGGFRGGGGGGTGRLDKALVDNRKAVSASMGTQQLHDPGLATASARLNKQQSLKEARDLLLKTVEGLAAEPPTREEVERAKTRLLRSIENQMTNVQSLALNLSEWVSMGDWRLLLLNRDRIRGVTPNDVVRVAKTYLVESNRTIGEFIPTDSPERAEIPVTPNLAELFKDYKGGEAIAQGEAFDPTPANIEARVVRSKLANGMKVVLLPRKTRGATVSALVQLHFGDAQSLRGMRAAVQLAGGLLMRGTRTKTRQQIQDEMNRLNARIVVTGGGGGGGGGGRRGGGPPVAGDATSASASIETTQENLAGALRLAVEMLREPSFPESDFEQIRQQRIAGIESGRSEPQALAALELLRRLSPFEAGDVRYVGSVDEQIAELKKVTLDDAKKFHARFYCAANGELVVVGEFERAELNKVAAELLGGWSSGLPYERLATPYKRADPANFKIETPDKQNALFQAGMRIRMSEDHPDYPAMLLANAMFGSGLGARMPNRIRNVEGLSYSVGSRFTAPDDGEGAQFIGMAISAPQNTPKVEASFLDELTKTLKGGFTSEEVARVKKAMLDQQAVARSQQQSLVRMLASREHSGKSMRWDAELEAKIAALTAEQVNAAFRRHIDPAALAIVKAGDFKAAGAYPE